MQHSPTSARPGKPAIRYAYKASLIGAAHQFELTEQGLAWRLAGRSGTWPYAEIAAIRLSFRPVSMQAHRFRADIHRTGGGRIAMLSTTWQTAALMAPQDQDYCAFIKELHARIRDAASGAVLTGGLSRPTYVGALMLVGLLAVAMAGLLVRALAVGEVAGAAFIIGFAALFGWQVGGFIRRNRPLAYTFDRIPQSLLP